MDLWVCKGYGEWSAMDLVMFGWDKCNGFRGNGYRN